MIDLVLFEERLAWLMEMKFHNFFWIFMCFLNWILWILVCLHDFLEFFQIGQIQSTAWVRSTESVSICFLRPNHVLNHSFSLLTYFPLDFDPLRAISVILQLLNASPSPIPFFLTSITFYSLQIFLNPKAPSLLSQILTVCTLIWSTTSFSYGT